MHKLDNELQQLRSIDLTVALAYVQDDRDLLITLVAKYMATTGWRIQQMEQALTEGRLEEVKRLAHTVKGSSGYVGAQRMVRLTQEMQSVSSDNEALALLQGMQSEYTALLVNFQEEFHSALPMENEPQGTER